MDGYSADVAAHRAGVEAAEVARLSALGIVAGSEDGGYTDADVRRIQVVQLLERSGLPSDALASLVRDGRLSLDFLDDASFRAFAPLSDVTFAELSERSGVPIDVLTVLRDATGGQAAEPTIASGRTSWRSFDSSNISCSSAFVPRPSSGRSVSTGTACDAWPRRRPSGGARRSRSGWWRTAAPLQASPNAPARSRRSYPRRRTER